MRKKALFFAILPLFYIIQIFSTSGLLFFLSYYFLTYILYKYTNNFKKSLIYSLILALFTDFGLAKSFFILHPESMSLGSGYSISPMTIYILLLLPLSLLKKSFKFQFVDLFILLFYISSLFSFFLFPYLNVFWGVISLTDVILLYFILRNNIERKDFENLSIILIFLLLFQSILAFVQFLLKRPIGQLIESVTINSPYGLVTSENTNLYRSTGTFTHPNFLASFILLTFPFIFFIPIKNKLFKYIRILPIIILVFTYSRAAWIILLALFISMVANKHYFDKFFKFLSTRIKLVLVIIPFLILPFIPYVTTRLNSFSLAFEDFGSMGVRFKTYSEALNIISQYPLTGVGLYRSITEYANNPFTDLFQVTQVGRFYGIHNTFLEIAAEVGLPGLLFFVLFLTLVFYHYWKSDRKYPKNAAFYGLLGLIAISMFNPFFHTAQFRLFFLLAAVIIV